jgi:ubiquinone/menaquinone biosynthesis C-methylase UbiE
VTKPSPIGGTDHPAAGAMLDPLLALVAPRRGERILEVGAGGGCYALSVAAELRPGGTLEILDAHPAMLAETMRAAGARGLANITPTLGDARFLPFADRTFHAAYLVAALGDMAESATVLRELARTLRPDGRLVVGELHGDPHRVAPVELARCAGAAGLRVAERVDGVLGYVARLERSGG